MQENREPNLRATWTTRLIRYADHAEMDWKNGAGRTREIVREDDGGGLVWRLSLATVVRSGPFSIFPGLERVITLIDGPSMDLRFDDGEGLTLKPGVPRRFSCERQVHADLADSRHRRDLNLLFRSGALHVQTESVDVRSRLGFRWAPRTTAICFVVSGAVSVRAHPDGSAELHPGDTIVCGSVDPDEEVRLCLDAPTTDAGCVIFSILQARW